MRLLLVGAGFTGVRWRVARVSLRAGQMITTADHEPITPWCEVGKRPSRKGGA
jgi:hypothetical protein